MSTTPLSSDDHLVETAFLGVTRSVTGRRWRRRAFDARAAETIAQRLDIDPLLSEVVAARQVTPDLAAAWLSPRLRDDLPDPSCLKGMDTAAARLADAIIAGETIGLFGDFDVDGTTSSAIMARYLRAVGAAPLIHLPNRQSEGYGPNLPAFLAMKEKGASLIVTLDCGATAHGVLAAAAEEGLEVIVVDHHLMSLPAPTAVAVVNPNRPDCLSGLTMLSAGGVTFLTLVALNRTLRERGFFADRPPPDLLRLLDLVALSLVCDVMPLKGLGRTLTRQGLALLGHIEGAGSGNQGIRALAAEAGAKGPAAAAHFGYAIGPRINAAGRIGHAMTAFDLLTTDDPVKAAALAAELSDLNGIRQGVEAAVLEEACKAAEDQGDRDAPLPLVVAGEGWHPGVIGIVAGRLKERFGRPALVISLAGEEGKGSGRSLPGVDLGAAIGAAVEAGLLLGGGGHPMAAGLTVRRDGLGELRAFLDARLGEAIAAAQADRVLSLDGIVAPTGITRSLHDGLLQAAPFGNGNPEPRFALADISVRELRVLKDKHMAVTLADDTGGRARGIAFGCVGQPLGDLLEAGRAGQRLHLAGRIKPDEYRGGNAAQIHLEDGAVVKDA
ncbi:single-stranded-DNA-specific exonuclease RecJ [Parvularcula bermudensis HTCC2503]|uniref:Single-stranded-DNA-specific exonuclease RecJ n=1 Tax=Parvularcula bermudensis (strain ATCC BAA-594 / HTCC2503 / KCTC 12087) TaxID=314260 RepID=E0TBT1_PARBH|nr:single-stranded-DNA-specific exonuclease RecJ [Parvularcula bermudensis]ADM08424.1 single-stranded-DNA-specific exonuclease RecJ [Parvularcula bermudensis HTCC2503]